MNDAATTAAEALMRDELAYCEDRGTRQMAAHIGALVVQEVRPIIESEATAAERQWWRQRVEHHASQMRQAILDGDHIVSRNYAAELLDSLVADLLDGDADG
jgi:hypothetical protein